MRAAGGVTLRDEGAGDHTSSPHPGRHEV